MRGCDKVEESKNSDPARVSQDEALAGTREAIMAILSSDNVEYSAWNNI